MQSIQHVSWGGKGNSKLQRIAENLSSRAIPFGTRVFLLQEHGVKNQGVQKNNLTWGMEVVGHCGQGWLHSKECLFIP